jgi:lipoate-protein ligase B
VIKLLQEYHIEGHRSTINSGVWVNGNYKMSAVGISASRWITMHGSSLNINCNMAYFNDIVPCGISPEIGGVEKMNHFHGLDLSCREVLPVWKQSFAQVFEREMVCMEKDEVRKLLLEAAAIEEAKNSGE